MKKLGLGAFLAGDELHVVDEQHVDGPVALAEIDDAVVADGVDHLVHEALGGDVRQLKRLIVLEHVLPDRVHQVCLAESHTAVDEQRVVGPRRRFRDRPAGRVRKLVGRADDERVEGVSRIEARRACHVHQGGHGHGSGTSFDGGGLLGAQRDAGRVGLSLRHEVDGEMTLPDLGQRLGDDARIVFREPVSEEEIRHPNRHRDRVL